MWEERVVCSTWDGGVDASRADVLQFNATWVWPSNEQIRVWLEGWEQWEKEQPIWCVIVHMPDNRAMP